MMCCDYYNKDTVIVVIKYFTVVNMKCGISYQITYAILISYGVYISFHTCGFPGYSGCAKQKLVLG